jgi:hypothetical protein
MANAVYNTFKKHIGTINWTDNAGTTIKCMLMTSGYVPNIDTQEFKSTIDATGFEVVGAGYAAGGNPVTNRTIVVDTVNDWAEYDADDTNWPASTITARGAVIYKDTGAAATSPVICYIDFGTDKTSAAGDFIIQWHLDGLFRIG